MSTGDKILDTELCQTLIFTGQILSFWLINGKREACIQLKDNFDDSKFSDKKAEQVPEVQWSSYM